MRLVVSAPAGEGHGEAPEARIVEVRCGLADAVEGS